MRRRLSLLRGWVVILGASLPLACAHYPVNQRSQHFDEQQGYRFDNLAQHENDDSLFICLAFSGGGTRAAALAYGVMEELRRTDIGGGRSLLDEVDCISSVSGGSFTAAYYGLFHQRLFDDFRTRFLDRNIQTALFNRLLYPSNWVRLASPYFGRIDLAAELYQQEIFDGKTIADLQTQGRPFVIMNATNLETGARFDFTDFHFNAMGSDAGPYPIGRAVAASSAFPFLLSPISVVNYPTAPDYQKPGWYDGALQSLHTARRRYQAARDLSYYFDKQHEYVHLMDGGLADNIGARAVLDAYSRGFIRTRMNNGRINQLVIIAVNARTAPAESLGRRESPPGLATVALKTATISMDNYSFDTVALIAQDLNQRLQAQKDVAGCQQQLTQNCPAAPRLPALGNEIDPYVVEVNFEAASQIPGENSEYYLNLPTTFELSAEQVQRLVAIGPKLLNASPQFQCLRDVLHATAAGQPRPERCPIGAGISGFDNQTNR